VTSAQFCPPDGTSWTLEDGHERAKRFLPQDVVISAEPTTSDADNLLISCHSEALREAIPPSSSKAWI